MSKDNTGPAFPCPPHADFTGLTIRDYIAIKAMQGFLANPAEHICRAKSDAIATWSYLIADVMLKERDS